MQDPQSLHKYAYVHGDPINGIDPTGRFTVTISLGSISVQANIRIGSAKATITAGYLAFEKGSTAIDIGQMMLQIALTGTVNPVDVAFLAFDLLPGSKIIKRIKAFVPSFGPGLNTGRKAMQNTSELLTRISRSVDEYGINPYVNVNGARARAVAITNRITEKVGELGGGFVGRSLGLAKETRYVKHGVHGFDDVLKKGDQYFILEAKGGTSTLAPSQMSQDWIWNNINKLDESPLKDDLLNAFGSNKLFGVVTETRIDQVTGNVFDPEYVVKSLDQIGSSTF